MEDLYLKLVKDLKKNPIFEIEEVGKLIRELDISDIEKHYKPQIDLVEKFYKEGNNGNIPTMKCLLDFPSMLRNYTVNVKDLISLNRSDLIYSAESDSIKSHYVRDENMLYSAVDGVYKTAMYEDELEALSMIWFRIIKSHPFSDGNKRTAAVGVKIALLKEFMESFVTIVVDYFNIFITSFLNDVTPQVQRNLNKLKQNGKKISDKSLQNIINYQKIKFKNEVNDIILQNENMVIEHLLENWQEFLVEEYILNVFIAQNYDHSSSSRERERIYALIKKHLLLVALGNSPSLVEIQLKIMGDINIRLEKSIEHGEIFTTENLVEILKKIKA